MNYTVEVKKDDVWDGMFMVVISREPQEIVSIPLRQVSYETATKNIAYLRYAFEAGLRANTEGIQKQLYKTPIITQKTDLK